MVLRTDIPARPAAPTAPLRHGERLNAEEFERRFDAMPHLKKAELINGVVHMPPPVSDEYHGAQHFDLGALLGIYRFATPGVAGGLEGTLRLDAASRPQPDTYLRIIPECGGRVQRDAGGYLTGGPELVVEVSASSVALDLGAKLETYLRHGVQEYIVWRVLQRCLEWRVLRGDRYEMLEPGPDGILRSEVFPGLWIDAGALIREDVEHAAKVMREGIESPEHAAFVQRLRDARTA